MSYTITTCPTCYHLQGLQNTRQSTIYSTHASMHLMTTHSDGGCESPGPAETIWQRAKSPGAAASVVPQSVGSFHGVGVLDPGGALNQLVKVYCVPLIPDGDAKRHKVYTGSGNRCHTSSLRERSCIPCTEVLVVWVYKQGERGS